MNLTRSRFRSYMLNVTFDIDLDIFLIPFGYEAVKHLSVLLSNFLNGIGLFYNYFYTH